MVVCTEKRLADAGRSQSVRTMRRAIPGAIRERDVLFEKVRRPGSPETGEAVNDLSCMWWSVSSQVWATDPLLAYVRGKSDALKEAVNDAGVVSGRVDRECRQSEVLVRRERAVVVCRRPKRVADKGIHQELRTMPAAGASVDLSQDEVLFSAVRDLGWSGVRQTSEIWREVTPLGGWANNTERVCIRSQARSPHACRHARTLRAGTSLGHGRKAGSATSGARASASQKRSKERQPPRQPGTVGAFASIWPACRGTTTLSNVYVFHAKGRECSRLKSSSA